jgi:CelD/BcsL family acetyltransferase involved in cellulose biosynthesis
MLMTSPKYRISSHIVKNPEEIMDDWLALQEASVCSYFQSWGWIGVWLEILALDLQPKVIRVFNNNELVGIGIFVEKELSRRIIFQSTAMFLNEYPFDDRNMVIEYNGLLVRRSHEQGAYVALINYLLDEQNNIDEIHFGAILNKAYIESAANQFPNKYTLIKKEESLSWYLNLENVGTNIDSILSNLSKNRRAQIRRSLRLYEESGPIKISEATSKDEAFDYLDGLKRLHTDRWQAKGRQGVFANPQWEKFHKSLIKERFQYGEIQLLKVENTEGDIGYLYNYLWGKRVYVLQTGFKMLDDKRLMPGYVVHCHAIIYNKNKGMKVYDFLHGDSLYKRILCDNQCTLYWMIVQKHKLKFQIENFFVKYVRIFRGLLSNTSD